MHHEEIRNEIRQDPPVKEVAYVLTDKDQNASYDLYERHDALFEFDSMFKKNIADFVDLLNLFPTYSLR